MLLIFLSACGSSSTDIKTGMSNSNNPLPPCPDSPNCIRVSEEFNISADTLFSVVSKSLSKMKPYSTEKNIDSLSFHAVFKIPVFGWKDDVNIMLQANKKNSIIHVRSASRVGYSDLGVNKRRVKKLLKIINKTLKDN